MAKKFVPKTGHHISKAKEIFDNLPVLNAETTPQRAPHSNTEILLSILLLRTQIIGICIDSLVHKQIFSHNYLLRAQIDQKQETCMAKKFA